MNIREGLEKIFEEYDKAKTQSFGGNETAQFIRNGFAQIIKDSGVLGKRDLQIYGSAGVGNWSTIPWIGIFNPQITTSAKHGVYVVYLFASDLKTVYLTLNQGCSKLKEEVGKKKAVQEMHKMAQQIIQDIDNRGFLEGACIDLRDKKELAYLYEQGTIFSRAYQRESLPDEETLLQDLGNMLDIYDEYVALENKMKEKKQPEMQMNKQPQKAVLKVQDIIEYIKRYIRTRGFSYEENMIENFYLSLKTKPFVILAGISGTGKTKLVELFAEAIGAKYKQVPVRPDWSDDSDLFGYVDLSGKRFIEGAVTSFIKEANNHLNRPYILCLDEMNLARVEYYFSSFLSIMETRKYSGKTIHSQNLVDIELYGNTEAKEKIGPLYFSENLYIVGTVNMDETTFSFSRKVLDRANTIEFSWVNLVPDKLDDEEVDPLQNVDNAFLKSNYLQITQCKDETKYVEELCTRLEEINQILRESQDHVGYRIRDEIVFYMIYNQQNHLMKEEEAFDFAIMQKILPRLRGNGSTLKNVLCELFLKIAGDYKQYSGTNSHEQMKNYIEKTASTCEHPRCANKLAWMVRRIEEDGFTSYWL